LVKMPKFMTETEEERLKRQAAQEEERQKQEAKKEQERIRKQNSDKWRIQPYSSSTTDEHGHHVKRGWKLVSNEKKVVTTQPPTV
jgi:hypothetical protein